MEVSGLAKKAKKTRYKLSLNQRKALLVRRLKFGALTVLFGLLAFYGWHTIGYSREYESEVVTGREIRKIDAGRTEVALRAIIPNSKQVRIETLPRGQKSDLVVHGANKMSGSYVVERYAVYETKTGYEVYGKLISGTRTYSKVEGKNATYLKMALYE